MLGRGTITGSTNPPGMPSAARDNGPAIFWMKARALWRDRPDESATPVIGSQDRVLTIITGVSRAAEGEASGVLMRTTGTSAR